ncbi:MAG: hypothetical protein K6E34_05605 [Lachnospiraceae bacterium]|nr:hypothetical protein [Lachnospiraceae bacterium]
MGSIKGKAIRTVVLAGLTFAVTGGLIAMGQPLIVALGVRMASFVTGAAGVAGGIFTLWSAGDLAVGSKKQLAIAAEERKTQKLDVKSDELTVEDMTSPEATRARLLRIREGSPGLMNLMDRCTAQLDRMDELQRRQGELLSLNKAAYLKDTVGTLDTVEREICLNLRGVVNQCIVAGDGADESRLDVEKVDSILAQNQKLLDQSRELLVVSADWIDKYNSQEGGADRSLLDNWIKVIQNTINGGGFA